MERLVIQGEVPSERVESVVAALPTLTAIYSADHVLLIHGMGGQTGYFYQELLRNDAVEVIWTGWCSDVWWTHLLRLLFVAGYAGLVKVLDRSVVDQLYQDVGAQSCCGLYFVPRTCEQMIVERVIRERAWDVSDLLAGESNYFFLEVDFDYRGTDPDAYYRKVVIGNHLDEELRTVLCRT